VKARAVIGSSFGDEGKGLTVDYLCRTQGAGSVVRFNGGANAGHTVVTPDGQRHIFRHFGSGTFLGIPTYLSSHFICNPILFFHELEELRQLGVKPAIYAHPDCLVTTFVDMLINQHHETEREHNRHGTTGVGVHETQIRSHAKHLKITFSDLLNHRNLQYILEELCGKYAPFRTGGSKIHDNGMTEAFIKACDAFAEWVKPAGIQQCHDPIFEGAQGLLLDQNNKEFFPHVTHSNTGMKNVRELCDQAGIVSCETYYVSRSYLTRHGAGPLPGEDPSMQFHDDTNQDNNWQGSLRFAPLDMDALFNRVLTDKQFPVTSGKGKNIHLVMTHCDQLVPPTHGSLMSYGPTANDVLGAK